MGITPFRLALDDVVGAVHRQPVAGTRLSDLGDPDFEQSGLGYDAGVAEADDLVGTPGDHPDVQLDVHRPAAVGRINGVQTELGEHRVDGGGKGAQRLSPYTVPFSLTRAVASPDAAATVAAPIRVLAVAVVVTFLLVLSQ